MISNGEGLATGPFVSVIVLGWGGEQFISTCLEALSRQTYPEYEVVVVDNASPDRTAEIVERDFPHVRLVCMEKNLGVAGGNNVGLRAAKGDILILTNVDTEARPDWIERFVEAFQSDPAMGVAGGKLLYPDGTIQYAGGEIDPAQGASCHTGEHSPDQPGDAGIVDTDFATGAALAMRREVLEQIGFEDEAYFPINYEDADMSFRARIAGWRVCYVPRAVSVHYESSTLTAVAPHRILSYLMGRLRFVCKFWSDERLRTVFFDVEVEWLRGLSDRQTAFATFAYGVMDLVYLKTLLDLDDLVEWRERLGVSSREGSRRTLTEVLTRLRAASLPQFQTVASGLVSSAPPDVVHRLLERWLLGGDVQGAVDDRRQLQPTLALLSATLSSLRGQVNPHVPIAWPHWPKGLWPKVKAALQKATRRLLCWYIDPIVEQQNRINVDTLQALNATAQEMLLMRTQWAAKEQALRAEVESLRQTLVSIENDGE
jgi:GT2 family glycosyltransferase